MWHHRKVTLRSTLTCTPPNCFNLIHQLRHLSVACHLAPEAALSCHGATQLLQEYQIGKFENDATLNLMTKALPAFVQRLRDSVQRHGISKNGVINHATLVSPKIAIGCLPCEKITSSRFRNEATLCKCGQDLMTKRIVKDYARAPVGMRQNLKFDGLYQFHALTCGFMLCLKLFKATPAVTEVMYNQDSEMLKTKFLKKLCRSLFVRRNAERG